MDGWSEEGWRLMTESVKTLHGL